MSYSEILSTQSATSIDLAVGEEALLAEKNHYWKTPSSGSKVTNGAFEVLR